ncbi:MAG: hypothetical protein HGA95_01740, partial [Caldiserica bacterium]|nr:hypothetical protein [Caldisericota bacterium]
MASKQAELEQIVVDYFRRRNDTTVSYSAPGVYQVELLSSTARQYFGSVSTIDSSTTLVFDSNMATIYPKGELITTGHRFLEIIRNDLEHDNLHNPRLTIAHVQLQPISPNGQLSIPELSFLLSQNSSSSLNYSIHYQPSFVLTYRVVYKTDQQSENIIRLVYDGRSGELRPDLLLRIDDVFIADGEPEQADPSGCLDIEQILNNAKIDLEARILPDIQSVGSKILLILNKDKQDAENSFKDKLTDLRQDDIEARRVLTEWRDKYIQDLEQKYSYKSISGLLSICRLWWPTLQYNISIVGKKRSLFIGDIPFKSQVGHTDWISCPTCQENERFSVCLVGHHIQCANCSDYLKECSVCGDAMCSQHASLCTHCRESVCVEDLSICASGKHDNDAHHCFNCLTPSTEDSKRLLCPDCIEFCTVCHRPFAPEHMKTCRLGKEILCVSPYAQGSNKTQPDGIECQECHEITCHTHGLETADKNWVCHDHGLETTCCKRIYPLSRVAACCVDLNEILCTDPQHRFHCAECNLSVCEQHSSTVKNKPGIRVCDIHRCVCSLCESSSSYLSKDLHRCVTCNRLVCSEHRQVCAVCGQPVCSEHILISQANEFLCPTHAGTCSSCLPEQNIHRIDQLASCAKCNIHVCSSHRVKCDICGKTHLCT